MGAVAVLHRRLGPYHFARLNALSAELPTIAIELSGEDRVYDWAKMHDASSFARETLFPNADSNELSGKLVATRVIEALNRHRPDTVVIHGWSDSGALGALLWCGMTGTPSVVLSESQERDAKRTMSGEATKRRIVRLFSAGFVGGEPHRDYLMRLGMPYDRIFMGYDVVDNTHFAAGAAMARSSAAALRQNLGLPAKFFLAVARFVEKKNILGLLNAYARYRGRAGESAWDLVVLGDGDLRGRVLQSRHQLGLEQNVLLPGFKQYHELPIYYGLAHAFVHASLVEQWGLVVNEAMAASLPILVSSSCGCVSSLVRDSINGFTFAPEIADRLAECMFRLSHGAVSLAQMGKASERIIAQFSTSAFASNLVQAIDSAHRHTNHSFGVADRTFLKCLIHIR